MNTPYWVATGLWVCVWLILIGSWWLTMHIRRRRADREFRERFIQHMDAYSPNWCETMGLSEAKSRARNAAEQWSAMSGHDNWPPFMPPIADQVPAEAPDPDTDCSGI